MAIAFVQSKTGSAPDNSAVSATFDVASTAGNLLVAVVSASENVTVSPPAGWSVAIAQLNSIDVAICYRENAPSSTSLSFSFGATSPSSSTVVIAEYSGIATSSPLDVTGSNTGTGTSPTTGSAGPTTQQNELLIGGLGSSVAAGLNTYSSPLNSFTLRAQVQELGNNNNNCALLDRIVSTNGTYSTGATLDTSATWAGVIATFKSATGDSLAFNKLLFSPRATPLAMPGVGNKLLKGP